MPLVDRTGTPIGKTRLRMSPQTAAKIHLRTNDVVEIGDMILEVPPGDWLLVPQAAWQRLMASALRSASTVVEEVQGEAAGPNGRRRKRRN